MYPGVSFELVHELSHKVVNRDSISKLRHFLCRTCKPLEVSSANQIIILTKIILFYSHSLFALPPRGFSFPRNHWLRIGLARERGVGSRNGAYKGAHILSCFSGKAAFYAISNFVAKLIRRHSPHLVRRSISSIDRARWNCGLSDSQCAFIREGFVCIDTVLFPRMPGEWAINCGTALFLPAVFVFLCLYCRSVAILLSDGTLLETYKSTHWTYVLWYFSASCWTACCLGVLNGFEWSFAGFKWFLCSLGSALFCSMQRFRYKFALRVHFVEVLSLRVHADGKRAEEIQHSLPRWKILQNRSVFPTVVSELLVS